MKQKTLFISALVVLLLVFVIGTLLYNAKPEPAVPTMAQSTTSGPAKAAPPSRLDPAALIRMHSPTLGKNDAPVVIVEFLDPACGTCRAFYPFVKEIMAAHPERIRLVLRYAPFHKGSDQVVALLEAARKQGKFWPALEALLAAQAEWSPNHTAQVDLAWKHLNGLGLDLARMRTDMAAPEVAKVIAQDVADAQTLNVDKTPAFFVNGRPLVEFGYEQLKNLVDDELKASQRK